MCQEAEKGLGTFGLGGAGKQRVRGARRRLGLVLGEPALCPRPPATAPHLCWCRTHMQNIKDITSNIHFEAYRVKRLNEGQSLLSNGVTDKELVANEM